MATPLIADDVLAAPAEHLFISPHYDDIALSAGATVHRLADLGRKPQTLIVFGSEPDPAADLSPFATAMHEGWGLASGEVIARRRAEEENAARAIGATVRLLPFHDAIYRGHNYLSDDDLFSTPAARDADLPAQIVASLGLPVVPDDSVRIYAPLGIGNHVDHQLVFNAAALLAAAGWDVWLYEDVPYALRQGARQRRLDAVRDNHPVEPHGKVVADAHWEAKVDGILSYPSQLETIFHHYVGVEPSREGIRNALTAYASEEDESNIGEMFWKLLNGSIAEGS
jgi:LmbE family N-acetylglucosaminyl deacetylase